MKNIKIIALILILLMASLFLVIENEKKPQTNTKPIVGVTTFALYDITKHIAGDTLDVVNILPFGVDPHSFEPTPKLMGNIEKSALVFYSGAGLEPWVHGFAFKQKAVNISKYVKLRELADTDENEEEEHAGHHHHEGVDPHYWLDFDNMKKAAKVITKELIALQPQYKELYIKNRDSYIKMLDALEQEYKQRLVNCRQKSVVVTHNALGYVADRYGFGVESLTGLSPEAQPSAKAMKRVFQDIRKKGIQTIFYENFVNDKVTKTIAKDANITVDVFQPLGNITADEAKAGMTYQTIMQKNLKKLSKALMCR
ncbi:zinc ABC transporter substrate-binding protein [Sulfurimonas sp. SWIR-19]|uniref:metal ABC transporter substrate-binding protein n=1 Tax=Sulfurimonas sp. SWIR-19 TaxID=2878390 RepID=UPI001CF4E787|nr:metal ABC transporter substrate-binding protein [Sulfurimonas sp. SWIR-19]UCN00307.1 zinc ABC transporter substrate-binding protein [Sulfurimonas sp. SWIR-19]